MQEHNVANEAEELAGEIIDHMHKWSDGKPTNTAIFAPAIACAHGLLHGAQLVHAVGATDDPLAWAIEVLTGEWPRVQEISSAKMNVPESAKH